jgi:disulfide bond formation protein DsbB
LAFFAAVGAMAFALYLEHVDGLEPCPLCVFQRVAMIATALIFLTAFAHNPKVIGQRIYSVLAIIASGAGVAIAARHSWLQHLPPDEVPACGPGLNYLLEAFPMVDVFQIVFNGSGECASISWKFLGLTLPEATLLVFVGFIAFAIFQFFYTKVCHLKEASL